MRTPRWSVAASSVALLAACSGIPDDDGAAAPADAPRPGATVSPTPGDGAGGGVGGGSPDPDRPVDGDEGLLAFTGRQLDGGTFDGSAVTGDVVVWFWTPW